MTELKEICKVQCGFAFDSKKFTEDDSFSPLIRIRDVKRGFTQTYYTGEFSSEYIVHKGDLLVGMDGEFNIARWNSEDALLNQRVCRIIANSNVNEDYLRFYLKRALKLIESKTSFVTVKHLSAKELNGLKLNLPCMEDQQRISKQLSILELVIRKNKKVLKLFDELVKARFMEMFGDPVLNEKSWRVIKLGELCSKICSGNTPKGGSDNYTKEGIMFFRSQNVWKNRLELDDIVYIDEATHEKMKETSLNYGDILITKTGRINTENSSLGRSALFLGKNDSANINGHVYLVRINSELVNRNFVLQILISPQYRDLIRRVCVGGIDKRQLNQNHIYDFPIIVPPLELQNQFASFVQEIDKSRLLSNHSLFLTKSIIF